MKVFIDLFSGLGGASAKFDVQPDWKVIKIDNNPLLVEHNRGLHLMDIGNVEQTIHSLRLMLAAIDEEYNGIEKLVVWASPPCTEFSFANADRPEFPSMDLIEASLDIIDQLQPTYWILENVRGAREHILADFEMWPTQSIGSVILWGHFPLIPIRTRDTWRHRKMESKGSRALRPNFRAKIPWPISEGLHTAIEHQQTLHDY